MNNSGSQPAAAGVASAAESEALVLLPALPVPDETRTAGQGLQYTLYGAAKLQEFAKAAVRADRQRRALQELGLPKPSEGAVPRAVVEAFSSQFTDRLFAGRKGHGGTPASYLQLRPESLANIIGIAYEAGAASVAKGAQEGSG